MGHVLTGIVEKRHSAGIRTLCTLHSSHGPYGGQRLHPMAEWLGGQIRVPNRVLLSSVSVEAEEGDESTT